MVAVCVSAGIISGMTVGSGRVELCAGGCMTRGIPGIFCDIFPSHITYAVPAALLRHVQGVTVSSAASVLFGTKTLTTR